MSGPGWPGANVLNIRVPLLFILAGITSLLVAISLIFLRPEVLTTYHYNQYVIAITHLIVLGWIGSVVMGAMYQLVPVALETRLFSQKLAGLQFALHLVGFCGMVWMFWTWNMKQVGHFGSVLGLGVLLFIYNLFRTLLRVPRWNVVATAIASTLSQIPVRRDLAMTGEITLRGRVLPIGGLKEKILAAKRAKLTTVILPKRNKKDLDEIPKHILRGIHLVFADTMDDVMKVALRQGSKPTHPTGKPKQPQPHSKKHAPRAKTQPAARSLPVHATSTATPPLQSH
jgi:hypothetical protein